MKKTSLKQSNTMNLLIPLIGPLAKFASKMSLMSIQFYKIYLSGYFGGHCRFDPSCSEYAKNAFEQHSFLRALYLSLSRLSRCHPFKSFGYDPVPRYLPNKRKQ